ncbi:unnamed protein product [Leuciscus chuanchicus]
MPTFSHTQALPVKLKREVRVTNNRAPTANTPRHQSYSVGGTTAVSPPDTLFGTFCDSTEDRKRQMHSERRSIRENRTMLRVHVAGSVPSEMLALYRHLQGGSENCGC